MTKLESLFQGLVRFLVGAIVAVTASISLSVLLRLSVHSAIWVACGLGVMFGTFAVMARRIIEYVAFKSILFGCMVGFLLGLIIANALAAFTAGETISPSKNQVLFSEIRIAMPIGGSVGALFGILYWAISARTKKIQKTNTA